MLPTLRLFVLSSLAALLYLPADLAAQTIVKPKKVCVGTTGEFIVRARCKKGEVALTLPAAHQKITETVIAGGPGPVGPIGPVGISPKGVVGNPGVKGQKGLIDFSGCRKTTPTSESKKDNINGSGPTISVYATCIPGAEFVYDEQFKITVFGNSAGTKVFVQSRSPDSQTVGNDTRDFFVEVTATRYASAGLGLYTLEVMLFCCPL